MALLPVMVESPGFLDVLKGGWKNIPQMVVKNGDLPW